MIKGIEFTKSMNCDKDVAVQVAEFCNTYNITKDRIIDIKYTKANNGTCCASAMLIYESVPATDVAPVRHGHWIEDFGCWYRRYECSECHGCINQELHYDYINNIMHYPKYCEHCGAKMSGKDDNDG